MFIINVLNNAREGVIQVIGDTVLDEEFRFSVSNSFSHQYLRISRYNPPFIARLQTGIQKLVMKMMQVIWILN